MTLILIKKDEFYFRNKINGGNWTLIPMEGANFPTVLQAQRYVDNHLKDCKGCKVVTVEVSWKEKNNP